MKPHTQPNTTTHTFPYLSEKSPLENNFLRILLLKTQRGVMVLVSWEDGSEGTDGVMSAFSFFFNLFCCENKVCCEPFSFRLYMVQDAQLT
jgi:hypothetical protein